MAHLTFAITPADHLNVTGRAVRRFFLTNNALKHAKLSTGDVVVLSAASQISHGVNMLSEDENARS
jgi:hypothetical protein